LVHRFYELGIERHSAAKRTRDPTAPERPLQALRGGQLGALLTAQVGTATGHRALEIAHGTSAGSIACEGDAHKLEFRGE
jgi:outer membrane lipoprotein SlyB